MWVLNYLILGLFRILVFLIRLLPRRAVLGLGTCLGFLAYAFLRRHRRLSLKNLKIAFGQTMSESQRRQLARQSFLHFGRMVLDTIKFAFLKRQDRSQLIQVEGLDNLRQALSQGRGVLIFSAHLGNWEVASWAISSFTPLHVVARPLDNPLLEKELLKMRQALGARVISKFLAARPILRALQAQESVAILIDQNVLRSQAVFVDFFGLTAATTPALASFHLHTQAPLLPIFCLMTPERRYLVKIHPPLSFSASKAAEPEALLQITQVLTKMIEQEIRQYPGQWLWFHDRWRTRPADGK